MSKSTDVEVKVKKTRTKKEHTPLQTYFDIKNLYEIGVDEAGRGPMFGRLYVAAVVLPKDGDFKHGDMKDSKKFTNKIKIKETAEYIKQHAIAWNIQYVENTVIDNTNILQSVMVGMHAAIRAVTQELDAKTNGDIDKYMLLIDGNYFTPHMVFDETSQSLREIPYETVEGGDNKYTCIAAASILAKVAHDEYIADMCAKYPILVERYSLDTHVGYGTKKHLDGIREHGITQWHRRSFGCCKTAKYSPIIEISSSLPPLS
jgi:ribonuclease HII